MQTTSGNRTIVQLQWASRLCTYLVAAYACIALIGWIAHLPVLTSIRTGLASTSVATAACFLLCAFAIHNLATQPPRWSALAQLRRGSAAVVILISLYALAGYLMRQADAGYLLGREFGRVSPATAACFILLASAALCADCGKGHIGTSLNVLGLIIIELDLVGYAYNVDALYQVTAFSAMALPTALSFAVLFTALLLARPYQGWIQYAARSDRVGRAFRFLLPAVIIIPMALTYLVQQATGAGHFRPAFAFAILTVSTTVALAALVCFVSAWVSRADAARRQAEDDLQENAELLEAAMGVAELGAWVADVPGLDSRDGQVELSAGAYRILGLEKDEYDGSPAALVNIVHPDDRTMVAEWSRTALEHDTPTRIAYRIVRPDGEIRWVQQQARARHDASTGAIQMVGIIKDVTDSRVVEQQLAQAQKMEAVGQLTGGLAHDFNNLLAVIIGNLDLASESLKGEQKVSEDLEAALGAALRGAELTRQLLAFSRRQPLQPKRVVINELVSDLTTILKRTLGEQITVETKLVDAPWPADVDPSQVESALMNMAVNARDAMPGGGRLIIETDNRTLDADYIALNPEAVPGDYIMLSVSDTGNGIPPEVLRKVFEPFFTTKAPGVGTGLGLSMVYGFVKQSGGHIKIYSELGIGTTIRLYLPKADATADVETQESTAESEPAGQGEIVLVVEDKADVRRIACRQLAELGYQVLDAEDANIALEVLRSARPIDLLFTDVVMPGPLSGPDLAREARKLRTDLKVLYTSGFPETARNGGAFASTDLLISKPYRQQELARKLREALA